MLIILLGWECLPWCWTCPPLQFASAAVCSLYSLLFMSVCLQLNVVARMLTIKILICLYMFVRAPNQEGSGSKTRSQEAYPLLADMYIYSICMSALHKWSVNWSNAYKHGRELQVDTLFDNLVISDKLEYDVDTCTYISVWKYVCCLLLGWCSHLIKGHVLILPLS